MKNGILNGLLVMATAVLVLVGCKLDLDLNKGLSDQDYTVTFHANGGAGTPPAAMTVEKISFFGETMPDEGDLLKSGYIVSCWNTNASGTGTNYYIGQTYSHGDFNGNITLYAKWDNFASCQTLGAKLKWLRAYAESDTVYTLEVSANESLGNQNLSFSDRNDITIHLKGIGGERVIARTSFSVGTGVTLILDNNITIESGADVGSVWSYTKLVVVSVRGCLIMREGAKIIGNRKTGFDSPYGSGICLSDNGTFTMNGGKISGNSVNTAFTSFGGGVYVSEGCSFTMNGGEITNNTAESAGGGVYIAAGGTFTKSGGIITGYTDDTANGNTVKSGYNIVNLRGHAVIYASTTNPKVRDSTAGPSVNMDSSVSGTAGGWDYGI